MKNFLTIVTFCFSFISVTASASQKNYSQYHSPANNNPKPYVAENGTYKGQISHKTYRPKNTYVKGYNRKGGTHIRGHYKSLKK